MLLAVKIVKKRFVDLDLFFVGQITVSLLLVKLPVCLLFVCLDVVIKMLVMYSKFWRLYSGVFYVIESAYSSDSLIVVGPVTH